MSPEAFHTLWALCAVSAAASIARAQFCEKRSDPIEGQAGKDVVWVPTPPVLVDRMLDMAGVTPADFVVDLGSGDGRIVIAAARRGACAMGVEYNPDLIEVSTRLAASAGVGERVTFVQEDLYEADISRATVLALFLLSENLCKLTPKFLQLRPGTRIVTNRFTIGDWEADETSRMGSSSTSCTAHVYVVPAQAGGTWHLPEGELRLEQKFQILCGTFEAHGDSTPIENGRLRGDEIRFSVGGTHYSGHVMGDIITGVMTGSDSKTWSAIRAPGN